MKNIGLIAVILAMFSSFSVMALETIANYDMRERPQDVRVVTRLVGRLDWGYDTYYDIELEVKGVVVASTTSIPEKTRAKREAIQAVINQAIEEGKYVDIFLSNFDESPADSVRVSSEDLPGHVDLQTADPNVVCNKKPKENWFIAWISKFNNR